MFTFILQLSLGIMAVSTLLYVIRVIKGLRYRTGSSRLMGSALI